MEKQNCVASFFIKLTSNATTIPLQENELRDLIRTFRYFQRHKALDILFRLKYGTMESKKTALNWFSSKNAEYETKSLIDLPLMQKIKHFSNEQFVLLADELQFQYQQSDPDFLNINSIKGLPGGCTKELNILQEKMADSLLLFFLVVKKCVNVRKNSAVTKWIVQLLSNNPASQCDGLKNIGFNFNYRLLIKQFSNEIGSLLLAMHKVYVERQMLLNTQDILSLPLVNQLKTIIELDIQDTQYSNSKTSSKQYHHSDVVASFENHVLKFIERADHIATENPYYAILAKYSTHLTAVGNAIIDLLTAQIEYKKVFAKYENSGILFVFATNQDEHTKMTTVQEEFSAARKAYHSALENFHDFYFKFIEVE